jgi:fibronectin type 3 domain-containing protein
MFNHHPNFWRKPVLGTFLMLVMACVLGFAATAGANAQDIVSINAGGPAVSNSGGGDNSFVADEDYNGGGTYSVTHAITIPASIATTAAPSAVYQTARQGVPTYTIPGLTAGTSYTVRLHFAELYFTAAGNREFNVAINGTTVLTNFDIFATAGAAYTAVVENYTATANSSGQIVIVFSAGAKDQPMVEGIEVLGLSAACATVPSAPTGLKATASSSSVIGLTWTADTAPANCTISGYNVYRSTTIGFIPGSSNLVASGVTTASYSNTGLAASTAYYFIVEALDSYGTSAASAQATATTQAPPSCTTVPSAPTGLAATASSSSVIGLTWTADTAPANCAISGYNVYRSTTSGFTPGSSNLVASGITTASYSNTGLTASTAYYFIVEALDADGNSAASAQATATTQAIPPTTDIVSINAGGPAVSNSGGGDFSFVADEYYTGGTTYSVTHAITIPASIATTAAPAAVYQTAREGAVTYTIPGLTSGNSYTVRLHFAELYFAAAASREFNVVINGTTVLTNFDIYATAGATYTAVVENYTATANSSGQIVIAFTNGAKDQPEFEGIEVLGSSATCAAVPSAPTGLTATASSSSVIGLSWTATTPPANCSISSYNVYRSTTSGFTPSTSNLIVSVSGTTYSNTGLAASTTYYYVVEATDAHGTSAASAQASAMTQAPTTCAAVPSAPTGFTATASSSSAISLSWTATTPPANCTISSYSVYGSTTSGFTASTSTLLSNSVTGTTYSNTGLAASSTHYYLVEATDAYGTSAASAQATATTQPTPPNTGYVSINAGGAAVSNSGGGDNPFVADEYFSAGGTTDSVTNAITIPASIATTAAPMAVYQTARQGVTTYTIPGLTSGTNYIVRLHFAELYFTAAANREFNVAINGTRVLTNFDIFANAGAAFTAVVEQYIEPANSSGQMVIAYTAGAKDQPMFNGIEVLDATPCTTIPAAPTGLTATAAYPSVINLSWTADTPPANCTINSYNVYGGTNANPTTLIASGLTGTTYSNTGLTASTTYYYVVKAVDAYGTSAASAQASTATPAPVVIAPPTGLTAVGSSYQQIDLRWVASTASAPNTSPVNYSVYRSTTTPFTPSSANLMGTTVGITNYVDSNYPATLTAGQSSIPPGPGVQPSTTYYYMVVATTLSGASSAATASATSLPATPSASAPAALTGLAAMAENANEIDLIWNSTNSGVGTVATTYYIYRSTTSPFTPASTNLIGTTKSNWFQDAVATASTQYYYQVLANNTIGTSPSSATVTATTPALNPNLWGGAPFWDASNMPALPAGDTVMMKFLNRTNGKYTNDQITWTANINGVASQYTFAQQPTFAMPPNSSGRMYFFLNDPTLAEDNTDYWDYIEFTAGPTSINMDTTRVDALGVKIAFKLTCGDGTNIALGENQQTFMEDRSVTFQRYLAASPYNLSGSAPYDYQTDETMYGPYRIIEPGGAGFNAGGPYQNYYATYISNIWSFNGITIPLAGSNGDGLGANPDLSAAIFRHTGPISGTHEFNAAGALTNQGMWGNPASFYQQEPYDHYAQWIEAQAINMQQYAFPYNDAGGYSSDIGCANPETLLIAVGW